MSERKSKANNLIEYVIVGKKKTKVVRISEAGVKKLIQKEIREGTQVADIIEQKLKRG